MVPDRVRVCCLVATLRGPSPLLLFALLFFFHFSPVSGALLSSRRGTRCLTPFAVPLAASSLRRAVRLGLWTKSTAGAARTAAVRTPAAPAHRPAAVTPHYCVNRICKKHNKSTLKSTRNTEKLSHFALQYSVLGKIKN
jgi:hypothetical protein